MEKIVDATFDGQVFRPDEPIDLKPNTKAKIIIEEKLVGEKKKRSRKPYAWVDLALAANLDLPADYALNIDDYLYRGKIISND